MKPAHPRLHFPMSEEVIKDTSLMSSSNITINNNITLTISNTMVASPLKVAGDQHRTHLKLKEGLRAIIAIWIITTHSLKNRLIGKLKPWQLNTWSRFKNKENSSSKLKKVMKRSLLSIRSFRHL